MTSSIYLAFLFGSYAFVVALAMIINQRRFVTMMIALIESPALVFLTGVLVLMGGVSVIYFHNIWTLDWRGILTCLGWVAAIEGILMIIVPERLIGFAKMILYKSKVIFVLAITYLAIGAYFISRAAFQLTAFQLEGFRI